MDGSVSAPDSADLENDDVIDEEKNGLTVPKRGRYNRAHSYVSNQG